MVFSFLLSFSERRVYNEVCNVIQVDELVLSIFKMSNSYMHEGLLY